MAALSIAGALLGGLGATAHKVIAALDVAPKSPWVNVLLTAMTPALATVFGLLIAPVRKRAIDWIAGTFSDGVCKIYLFGHKGTGKTTLIENVLSSAAQPPTRASTEFYDCFSNAISVDSRGTKRVTIEMADYKGEKPSMIVLDLPDDFAGPKTNRRINTLFFFVDIVPRLLDETNGKPLDDDATLEWLRTDAATKIQKRIEQHHEYLSKYTLEIVFSLVYSPRLYSVRFLINKADLMRKAVSKGYLPAVSEPNVDQFTRSLFAGIEANIAEACSANKIEDFSVHLISAKHDEGTRSMFAKIIDNYCKRAGRV